MKKILINHTNHPSTGWDDKQKEGWDKIVDIPFPNIKPVADTNEVKEIVLESIKGIEKIIKEVDKEAEVYIMLQGEFTYCYLMIKLLNSLPIKVAIPTTERTAVVENGVKTSKFEFVRWRIIP